MTSGLNYQICEYYNFSIKFVNGLLTAIVGKTVLFSPGEPTNKLLSLSGTGSDRTWMEVFPAMPTKHSYTAAICSGKSLIVAGGTQSRNDPFISIVMHSLILVEQKVGN